MFHISFNVLGGKRLEICNTMQNNQFHVSEKPNVAQKMGVKKYS